MKVLRNIIIIFMILIVIIVAVFLILINKAEKEDKELLEEAFETANKLTKIDTKAEYFYIKNCMENYKLFSLNLGDSLEEIEEDTNDVDSENYKEELLKVIPQFVRDELNINTDNAYEKIGLPYKYIRIDNIYKSMQTINNKAYENETDISAYVVKSTLIDEDTHEQEKNSTIILMDFNTTTYYIIPQLYIETKKIDIEEGAPLLLYQEKTIEKNNYNEFKITSKRDADMVKEYLNIMVINLNYDLEKAYTLLDETYRNARFGSLEEFKKYVEQNKETFDKANLSKYKVDITDEYKQYVAIDQNDNYYIFRENAIMDYHVILDTYTIDLPEFIEKYNKASEQEKVALNINKFIQAINAKDYKYAYSKLAEGFKNNYFKTQESFEQYIKEKLYANNEIEFNNFNNQANIYTYTTVITDKETKQTKQQNFVVKLKEGTDFEMSFEV